MTTPPPRTEPPYRMTPAWRVYDAVTQAVDRRIGWDRLPWPLGLIVLIGVRNVLRRRNLHDTTGLPSTGEAPVPPPDPVHATTRTADGTYNDLSAPKMGRAGSRFGRNIPLEDVRRAPTPDLLEPNPRTVSRELLTRRRFQAVPHLNTLTAAWLQFMIRDWFSHGRGSHEDVWEIQLVDTDPWPERPMVIPKTPPDPTRPPGSDGLPPTFLNTETHWWDGSSIYGSDLATQRGLRTMRDGKLHIRPDGVLALPDDPQRDPSRVPGWWLGLSLLGSLFVLEHNAICDRLRREYPTWSDEQLFQRARLINAAVLARIHTVEWTPAVISHPTTRIAMHANWYGLTGRRLTRALGRLTRDEVISGIVGSQTNHFDVPYALTEEFVAVYRMHPLIPDDWTFRSRHDDRVLEERPFREIQGPEAQAIQERIGIDDLLYSFGRAHPGQIRLHNFPRDLQDFVRPNDGKRQDLAATDILRSRELGVPRYNEFRRILHLPPAKSFETLTDDPQWAEELRRVYDDDLEKVDLTVGMFAEPLPKGFAFSDTAFRIFILMASRRLNSDRFFTKDFTPQVYTPAGMEWIDQADMTTVILRHVPQLAPALRGLDNAFSPWNGATS